MPTCQPGAQSCPADSVEHEVRPEQGAHVTGLRTACKMQITRPSAH